MTYLLTWVKSLANITNPVTTVPSLPNQLPDFSASQVKVQQDFGRRVVLKAKAGTDDKIYGTSGLLQPIKATNGLVWPYQPSINWEQSVNYSTIDLVHSNQEFLAFVRSNAAKFTITGKFTVQNQEQGLYSLAALHFMRTMTKMYFGSDDPNAGTPPPVLDLYAYGQMMFNYLPVIVTGFNITLPDDVDYIPIDTSVYVNTSGNSSQGQTPVPGLNFDINTAKNLTLNSTSGSIASSLQQNHTYAWLPAMFDLTVNLTVQNTPTRLRSFSLDDFRTGSLLKSTRWT